MKQQSQSFPNSSNPKAMNLPAKNRIEYKQTLVPQKKTHLQEMLSIANSIKNESSASEDSNKFQPYPNSKKQKRTRILTLIAMRNQIIKKIRAHNRKASQQLIPSKQEIQSCVQHLEKTFPKMRIDHTLKKMLSLMNVSTRTSLESEKQESSPPPIDYSRANVEVRQKAAIRIPPDLPLTIEQRIAVSYLNHGYGLRILRQYIKDPSIGATRYNNVITSIMKLSFRKLQEFIKKLGQPMVPVNSHDQKVIRAPLTNCEKWMPPEQVEAFYSFIKLACNLETKLEINAGSALKLYNSCIRQLQQRQSRQMKLRNQKMVKDNQRLQRIIQNTYNLVDSHSTSDVQSMRQAVYDTDFLHANKNGVNSKYVPQQFTPKPLKFYLQAPSQSKQNLKAKQKPPQN